jgi:predicted dienelactone hydrolase
VATASGATTPAHHHTAPPKPKPKPPPAKPQPGAIGTYQVQSASYTFYDSSRPQLGTRALPVEVRYPVVPAAEVAAGKLTKGPFPLVVFSPGWLQCASQYGPLLQDWSSAGYVVAVISFPRTTCGGPGPEGDMMNEPGDVSAVITRLLGLSAGTTAVLAGMINPSEIAVAGHSDGGDVTAAVAANTCCLNHQVGAAIVLAGAEYPYGGTYFPSGTPPILFVQGNADPVNVPADSQQLYRSDTASTSFYLDLFGAGHFTPYQGSSPPEPIVAKVGVDFLNRYLAGEASYAGALTADGNVSGQSRLYSGGQFSG